MCYDLIAVEMPTFRKCEPVSVLKPIRSTLSFSKQNKTGDIKRTSGSLFLIVHLSALVRIMLATTPSHPQNFRGLT